MDHLISFIFTAGATTLSSILCFGLPSLPC